MAKAKKEEVLKPLVKKKKKKKFFQALRTGQWADLPREESQVLSLYSGAD